MRMSLKVLATLWGILFLVLGVLFFNAYSKFHPETFLSVLNEQVKKNYPDAKLTIEEIDTSLSVDFSLNLKNLILKRNKNILAKIGTVELKVPWWLLLFNRGNAQVNVTDLDFFVDHSEEIPTPDQVKTTTDKIITVKIPNYLSGAQYTFRAKNISIRDSDSERRYLVISKFLLREFKYGQNSAFEINIPISINHRNKDYSSDLWIFGDVTPQYDSWKLNYRGEFKNRESLDRFKLEEILIDGKAEFKTSDTDFVTSLNLLFENQNVGQGLIVLNRQDLNVTLDFSKLPITYIKQIGEEIENPYWQNLEGSAEGKLTLSKSLKNDIAKIKGRFLFNEKLDLAQGASFDGKWVLDFQDTKWEASFISPQGEVSLFRRSVFDYNKGKVLQYTQELGFSGVDIHQAVQSVIGIGDFQKLLATNYFTTTISFKKCILGEKVLEGSAHYGITPEQKYYQVEFSENEHTLKVNFQDKFPIKSLDVEANKFQWLSNYKFLTPYFDAADAIISGKMMMRWKESWFMGDGTLAFNLSELKGPSGQLMDFYQKAWKTFNIDTSVVLNQNLNISFSKSLLKLNATLTGVDPAILSGQLATGKVLGTKSFLTLSYPKNKQWKPVKKEVLENYFPQDEL